MGVECERGWIWLAGRPKAGGTGARALRILSMSAPAEGGMAWQCFCRLDRSSGEREEAEQGCWVCRARHPEVDKSPHSSPCNRYKKTCLEGGERVRLEQESIWNWKRLEQGERTVCMLDE